MSKHADDAGLDVQALVLESVRAYLGVGDGLALSSNLLADFGVDSLALVAILLDLAERLQLDLGQTRVSLKSIETMQDFVALVSALDAGIGTR
jgi:acyl carrier protein